MFEGKSGKINIWLLYKMHWEVLDVSLSGNGAYGSAQ